MTAKESIFVGQQSLSNTLLLFFSISCFDGSVRGMLTLSPMTVAPVCCVGDRLNLTCTASVEFITWSFMVVNRLGEDAEFTIFSSTFDVSMPTVVNSTTFTLIRNSPQSVLPLIVTLSIDSVSIGLNGTVVNCIDTRNSTTSASTTIQIIDTSNTHYTLTLRNTSEYYSADYVTVSVEWTQQVYATYAVKVVPPAPVVFTGSTSCQLTIPYNMEYNLTVEASVPCRTNTTALIRLKYANCGHPELFFQRVSINDSVLSGVDYDGLPVEGSTITFTCPPGLTLAGPNSTTCTENGEWQLDHNRPMCIKSKVTCGHPLSDSIICFINNGSTILINYMDSVIEGTTVTFGCLPDHVLIGPNSTTCMGNGEWEPEPREVECKALGILQTEESSSSDVLAVAVSSAVIASLAVSILTFIAGFVCGHYFRCKRYKESTEKIPAVALYEDVNVLSNTVSNQEQDVELKENVAYGPSKSMMVTVEQ